MWIKGWISLAALLGITWLFGFAFTHYNQCAYCFVILNGLQGLFIFIFRCVCNVQYRNAFVQKFKSLYPNRKDFNYNKNNSNVKSESKVFALTQSKTIGKFFYFLYSLFSLVITVMIIIIIIIILLI
ncbi:conserved hypothetical protein [Pediculus humanus corporis]|uniref:Uncharacterized protein n=1 Tax=Pediculus humanus subsp. corporis TaxID=121224 RepID=E0VPQ3_PEDHC|nr:uncharacterized protein Phum_PHUM363100 [Pediculus humanus corporis]EEB15359.1 conserved hypothetical protein [Pediculus humanus corporis]